MKLTIGKKERYKQTVKLFYKCNSRLNFIAED